MLRIIPTRKGEQLTEWKPEKDLIPYEMRFKKGAYVMILSNDVESWTYANGDCGWIEDYDSKNDAFIVKLARNDSIVEIGRILRKNLTDKQPVSKHFSNNFSPYSDYRTGQWVIGEIEYHPLRLAWASTIHKSQGLSLDRVQIDARPQFFGASAMGYVSISRAKTPENLVIVGTPQMVANKIFLDKEVKRFV